MSSRGFIIIRWLIAWVVILIATYCASFLLEPFFPFSDGYGWLWFALLISIGFSLPLFLLCGVAHYLLERYSPTVSAGAKIGRVILIISSLVALGALLSTVLPVNLDTVIWGPLKFLGGR